MNQATHSQDSRAQFHDTGWSMVLAAGEISSADSYAALEKLCRTYWSPIYAFVRRQGHGPDDAHDLTQEFFARFLAKKQIKLADPVRGRFRSFLITSLKNFLVNEWDRKHSEKRGAGQVLVSLDEQRDAETRLVAEPIDPTATPDQVFDQRWALTLLEKVLSQVHQEYANDGRQEQFEALKPLVWGDSGNGSQAQRTGRPPF